MPEQPQITKSVSRNCSAKIGNAKKSCKTCTKNKKYYNDLVSAEASLLDDIFVCLMTIFTSPSFDNHFQQFQFNVALFLALVECLVANEEIQEKMGKNDLCTLDTTLQSQSAFEKSRYLNSVDGFNKTTQKFVHNKRVDPFIMEKDKDCKVGDDDLAIFSNDKTNSFNFNMQIGSILALTNARLKEWEKMGRNAVL